MGKGNRTVLFAWVDWSDKNGGNPSQATLEARFASLTKTLKDASFNQLSVDYTIFAGPVRVALPSSSYVTDHASLMNEAKDILKADHNIDADTFDFFGIGMYMCFTFGFKNIL